MALQLDKLTDAALRRAAADPAVREVRAAGQPLRLRFAPARSRGSWYVVRHARGRARWVKVGSWPGLPAAQMLAKLPEVLGRLAADDKARIAQLDAPTTLAAVLRWHLARQLAGRALSESRRTGLTIAVDKHLLPLLDAAKGLPLQGLTRAQLDAAVLQPLAMQYAPATVRLDFAALRAACRRAATLGVLDADPTAGWRLADFGLSKPNPKAARLRASHLPALLVSWAALPPPHRLLLGLLVLCGTRIGETRRARWVDFDLCGPDPAWHIPAAHTKTGEALRVPLPPLAVDFLQSYQAHARGPLLLPSPGNPRQPLSHHLAWSWVRQASDGAWSAHDIRKLCATCWADAGADLFVVQMLQNHKLRELDATYIHTTAESKKRAALEQWAQQLAQHWQGLPWQIVRRKRK